MERYARSIWTLILTLSFAACAATSFAQASPSSPSADDVKTLRKVVAERDYYKASFEESERQRAAWQTSAGAWKTLFESEKRRADEVQGGRIDELRAEIEALKKQAAIFRLQADSDRQRISEQTFQIRKLKSERKWVFLTGLGTGFAAGAVTGYQTRARFTF